MVGLDMLFKSGSGPELVATRFEPTALYDGTGHERRASRGKPTGDADPRAQGSFPWSRAVKALAIFFLFWAAWARRHQRDPSTPRPVLQGMEGTPASSLNYALSKKNAWLAEMFGSDKNGDPLPSRLLRRNNPDLKRRGEPVTLSLNMQMLPPEKIRVFLDGVPVEDPAELERLAGEVEAQWAARPTTLPPTRRAGRPPAPAAPAGTGGGAGPPATGKRARPARVTARREILILKVDRVFGDYSKEEQDQLLEEIRALLESTRGDLLIGTREGCVEVILRLTPGEAERLLALAESGVLDDFGVIGARVVSSPAERQALLNGPSPTPPRRAEGGFPAPAGPDPELLLPLSALAPSGTREAAWDAIYRDYHPRVLASALLALGDARRAEAEDLTQEVFTRAFTGRGRWNPERPLWPWLEAILGRVVRERWRGHRRLRPHHSLEAAGLVVADPAPRPPDRLVSREFSERFAAALLALPPEMRDVIVARYYQKKTLAQIAGTMSVSPTTIWRRLATARARLRAALGDPPFSPAEIREANLADALGAAFQALGASPPDPGVEE
jgi:RNA polymerase sigma-70 factor (ECF subfamily)